MTNEPDTLAVSQEARDAAEAVFDAVLGDAGSYAEYSLPSYREGGIRTLGEAFARFERATIERQAQAGGDRLREAVSPVVDALDGWEDSPDTHPLWDHPIAIGLTVGDLRRITALATQGETK